MTCPTALITSDAPGSAWRPRFPFAPALVRESTPWYGEAEVAANSLEALGDEIATLAAHIHAATHRLLVMIAEFDERRGWELGGHPSCAHWLEFRTGVDLGACREKVRAARALVGLPETSAAMARGELSFSQVRALSRVATSETNAVYSSSLAAAPPARSSGWSGAGSARTAGRARRRRVVGKRQPRSRASSAVCATACVVPTRRALAVEPTEALRVDG